jgi:hypothetical protein
MIAKDLKPADEENDYHTESKEHENEKDYEKEVKKTRQIDHISPFTNKCRILFSNQTVILCFVEHLLHIRLFS